MSLISVNIQGGLGNLMFQIANGLALSLRNNYDFFVDLSSYYGGHYSIDKYKDNILRKVKFDHTDNEFRSFGEGGFHFTEVPKLLGKTKLNGYFQSEKYFCDKRAEVVDFFSPTDIIQNKVQSFFKTLGDVMTCSVHVRRGDFTHLENYHPTLPIEYYEKACKILGNNTVFLIFSDDLLWCKKNLQFIEKKVFVENYQDFEEIYLMSHCNSHIIANSTFSWWGAWLSKKDDIVIAPKTWFGSALSQHNTKDIYLDKWIKI